MNEIIYYRFGKKYRKTGRNEVILSGAMQSWCHGELQPVIELDIIGDTPSSFSPERNFYNPIQEVDNQTVSVDKPLN